MVVLFLLIVRQWDQNLVVDKWSRQDFYLGNGGQVCGINLYCWRYWMVSGQLCIGGQMLLAINHNISLAVGIVVIAIISLIVAVFGIKVLLKFQTVFQFQFYC